MLDILKIKEMMDKGHGGSPYILLYDKHDNMTFRLSKKFKGKWYHKEVSTRSPRLSKASIQVQVEFGVLGLQDTIDQIAQEGE